LIFVVIRDRISMISNYDLFFHFRQKSYPPPFGNAFSKCEPILNVYPIILFIIVIYLYFAIAKIQASIIVEGWGVNSSIVI